MLTNISNNSVSQRYQGQQVYQNQSDAQTLKANSEKTVKQDTVTLSQESSSLTQTYKTKQQQLEQNYSNDANALEREFQQEKSRLQREYSQKKKSLGINMYA